MWLRSLFALTLTQWFKYTSVAWTLAKVIVKLLLGASHFGCGVGVISFFGMGGGSQLFVPFGLLVL